MKRAPGEEAQNPPSEISQSAKANIADTPHWVTILLGILGLLSPLIAAGALYIAVLSFRNNETAVKVSQRAYLSYEASVTNQDEVLKAIAEDKSFFLRFQIKVNNQGNTPAEITPKINIQPDPDWIPFMITFPNDLPFDLGPKESRVLFGQVMFSHTNHKRAAPGVATGFTGQIEFKDVFDETRKKDVCYSWAILNGGVLSGLCGTVFQPWTIK